jgi:hypothetical protein
MTTKPSYLDLDSKTISMLIKRMDRDVATRMVASALSLNKKKLSEAIEVACHEMEIRLKEKNEKNVSDLDRVTKEYLSTLYGVGNYSSTEQYDDYYDDPEDDDGNER